jgi:hypothetical protein
MERPRLLELEIAAEPEAWRASGFAVDADGRCRIASTDLLLRGGSGGVVGWTLEGAIPGGDGIDGLATRTGHLSRPEPPAAQPNGVTAIDHVVVATPDTARTFEAFEGAGLELRRVRDAGTPERPLRQGFLLLAEALVEVVGPPEPDEHAAGTPASFWGVTLVADDLDATVAALGERIGPARDAVQPGRRIAVVTREAGLGLPVAVMSPRAELGA